MISHVEVSTIGSNFPFRRRNNIAELKNEIITAVKLSCQSTVLLHNLRYSYIIQRIVRIMCEVSGAVCVQSSVVCLQRTSVVRTITHSAFGGLISSRDFTDVAVTVENDQFISTNGTFAGAWLLFGWWHGWVGESGEIRSVDIVHSH